MACWIELIEARRAGKKYRSARAIIASITKRLVESIKTSRETHTRDYTAFARKNQEHSCNISLDIYSDSMTETYLKDDEGPPSSFALQATRKPARNIS